MAEQPRRPRYRDGRPLAAADLELAVDHGRNRDARHDRALHTPGIALGLRMRSEDLPMTANGRTVVTKRLTVTAGVANDGNGTQVVLANDQPLAPEQFVEDVGTPEPDRTHPIPGASFPYPVLLTAEERDGPADAFAPQGCGAGGGPTRVLEDVRVRIGRRGEHLTLAAQQPLGPGGTLAEPAPWRLLLGFVRYHEDLKRWVEVLDELDNVRPRRAGVRAGEVISTDDRLLVRVGEPPVPGQPALLLETAGGGRMRFGRTTADGGVEEVLSVSTGGAVKVNGTIDPGLVVGTVRVQSGVATDGMPLPLPPGVTAAELQAGTVVLHVQVTPRYPPADPDQAYVVARCEVDSLRVVHCELKLLESGSSAHTPVAASCNYLVAAAVVAAGPGATP
jgi:hypothetical protein